MDLPNLYFADLGPDLALSPTTVRDACFAIRRNRDNWLVRQRTRALVELLAFAGDQWLDPLNTFRVRALSEGATELGVGPGTMARGLDGFLRTLTAENLEALIIQDLGEAKRLDLFVGTMPELRSGRLSLARGPDLVAHICASNLPNPTLMSLVLGVLTKSAQFFKLSTQGNLVPRLFAHSLAQLEPKLGACLEFAQWPRGSAQLDDALFAEADCVTATGSDEMLTTLRNQVPPKVRFLGYGHRVSFAFIASEMLTIYGLKRLAQDAATDIAAWNQLGCLSPQVYYVQENGVVSPEGFAVALAEQLAKIESTEPRGPISDHSSAAIYSARTVYEMRRANAFGLADRPDGESVFFESASTVQVWQSVDSTAWTVVLDTDPAFKATSGNRFIYVKPVKRLADVLRFAEPVRHHTSTVGLAAPDELMSTYALDLARWGASRICPIGKMQAPPLLWRHDGRSPLADLVTWTDLES